MNNRLLILVLSALLLPVFASAQSISEIEAAKAMAKSYGYSESEIEALLNDPSKARSQSEAVTLETSQEPEGVIQLKQAKKDEETEIDKTKQIFGHDFFSSKGLSIIPSINAPAPANYILGPGDDITIDVWGNSTAKINSVVARDGTILINGVGPVAIGGMTIKRAESTLKTRLSRIYGDIGSSTHIKLSLNRARSITVNVVGDVVVPGAYALPALAQVTSALFMAGGVEETASVRDIRLYRDGKFAGSFDLYDFVFHGACRTETSSPSLPTIPSSPWTETPSVRCATKPGKGKRSPT